MVPIWNVYLHNNKMTKLLCKIPLHNLDDLVNYISCTFFVFVMKVEITSEWHKEKKKEYDTVTVKDILKNISFLQ